MLKRAKRAPSAQPPLQGYFTHRFCHTAIELLETFGSALIEKIIAAYRECSV